MFNHEIFAVSFGHSLELTRNGAPVEERKSALSAVYALTSNASAMMRVYQDMLTIDDVGIPDSLPYVPGIIPGSPEYPCEQPRLQQRSELYEERKHGVGQQRGPNHRGQL